MEDLALTNGKVHYYQVQAEDANGNKSPKTAYVNAIPVAGPEWAP